MKTKPAKAIDVAFLQGPTEDGKGARVVRVRNGMISAGEVRPAREGEPLHDRELVRLKPIHAELPICAIEVLHGPTSAPEVAAESADGRSSGGSSDARSEARPARVATDSYRKNWSAVFARKRANNALN